MATFKYFSGTTELRDPHNMRIAEFVARFPGIKGRRYDSFSMFVGYDANKTLCPVTRKIEFKSNPSLHKCDARCMNATRFLCECACGGKNHGAGNFACAA